MSAVFRPDQRADSQIIELMAFGHPIVDAIVKKVRERYEGVTGTRRILAGDDLEPTSGWLFSYSFTVPGVRQMEYLMPIFVSDAGEISTEVGQAIVERACLFDKSEEEVGQTDIPNNLSEVKPIVEVYVNERQQALQSQATTQATTQVDGDCKAH